MRCPSCGDDHAPARDGGACPGPGPESLAPGAVVAGRYEVLRPLGACGMGAVFAVRDRMLDETVALKLLRAPERAGANERFRQEIKLAWRVRHRNVCGLREYGEEGGRAYITMELVEGRNLRQLQRERGALPWEEAFALAVQVAEGLAAVHEAGILHRDLKGVPEHRVRDHRHDVGIRPVYKRVDSCAAEFAASTAYLYSTYEEECDASPTDRRKIVVLGGGPNRIGQGIEFDYCCVHAAFALRDDGFETIMINCHPETVSTDYDTSDRLYFEPLTLEDVLEIIHKERPEGVIVQYGGQTPLKLARDLHAAGAPIIGTTPDSIDIAEDRERFQQLLNRLGLRQPPNRTARTEEAALALADNRLNACERPAR